MHRQAGQKEVFKGMSLRFLRGEKMKTRKPTTRELERALLVVKKLDSIVLWESFQFEDEDEDESFDPEDEDHLKRFYEIVSGGYSSCHLQYLLLALGDILDSDILDPNDRCLALNPKYVEKKDA